MPTLDDERRFRPAGPIQPPTQGGSSILSKIKRAFYLAIYLIMAAYFYVVIRDALPELPAMLDRMAARLETIKSDADARIQAAEHRSHLVEGATRTDPSSPNARPVRARSLTAAPGAVVCHDFAAVSMMFRQYGQHWEDAFQDRLTKGLSQQIRGQSTEEPDLALYGCVLVPDGDIMLQDPKGAVPIVTTQLKDGFYFKGVTLPQMVGPVSPNIKN